MPEGFHTAARAREVTIGPRQPRGPLFDRVGRLSLLAAITVTLLVAAAFLFIAFPSGDDFCRALSIVPHHGGEIATVFPMSPKESVSLAFFNRQYFEWSGRWASLILEILGMSVLDPARFYWLPLVLLAGTHVAAVYLLARVFLPQALAWRAALVAVGLFWALMPAPGEGIYWLTGGVENLLCISLMVMLFAGLVRGGRPWFQVCLALLSIFAVGVQEMFGMLFAIVLLVGTLVAFRVRHPNRRTWVLVLAAVSVGLFICLAAPGNMMRMRRTPEGQHLGLVLRIASRQLAECGWKWLLDPKFLCASILFAVHPAVRALRPSWLEWRRVRWTWILPLTWAILMIIPFLMKPWSTGDRMYGRTLNGVYAVFLLGWFANVFVFTRRFAGPVDSTTTRSRSLVSFLLLTLATLLVFTGNTRRAVVDLCTTALPFREASRARDAEMRRDASRGQRNLRMNTLPPCPVTLYDNDFTRDPKGWRNECISIFYGVDSVQSSPMPK